MSITARTPEAAYSASANNLTCNVPAGTTNGDFMLAHIVLVGKTLATATGWTLVSSYVVGGTNTNYYVYCRIASSEPANYNFTFSDTCHCRVVIGSFLVANLNTASPVAAFSAGVDGWSGAGDAICSTIYTPPYPGMDSIFVVGMYDSGGVTFGPAVSTGGAWTEVYDAGDTDSDIYTCIDTYVNPESGTMTVSCNKSDTDNSVRCAFAVALSVPKIASGIVMMF
jgi:hypothetical protein